MGCGVKCFFALSLPGASTDYVEYARVAIWTARRVGFDPVLLHDGPAPDIEVDKIAIRSRFAADMEAVLTPGELAIASGAMLRLEVPWLCDDVCVYADVDTMFLRKLEVPPIGHWGMTGLSLTPAYEFNSGVCLMNPLGLREDKESFDSYCRSVIKSSVLPKINWDEGLINFFYLGRITRIAPGWNWRPYQGANDDAGVVHFHGPKPLDSQDRIVTCYNRALWPTEFYEQRAAWLAVREAIG